MDDDITKSKVLSSLLWKLLERGGTQGIQFIVMIILARLLLPEDFGLLVLVAIFITLAGVIVQSGFNTALIQRKNVDEVDYSSVFYLNLFVATNLYIILFFTAPFIASFFAEPQLVSVLRILSFTLFFGAFNSIQHAVIARNMQFKKLFYSSLGAVIISGVVGITMAYAGYSVWALVGQQITNQLIVTIILWFTVNWRPRFLFSMERIRILFTFGWKLLASSLIDTLSSNIRNLLIGKMFSPAILGFYNRGEQFPSVIINNINGSIQSVMLPTLSFHQDNAERVKVMVRRSIVMSSFVIFPMMFGLAAIAEPLVKIVLTEKWLPSVPFLQIFCVSYALWPIHTANLQAINALGRSDIFLKLEIVKTILGLIILAVSIPFGVQMMALGVLGVGILSAFINAYPNLLLLNYSIQEQWRDIKPSLLTSLVMGAIVFPIHLIGLTDSVTLIIQIIVGIVLYVGLAKVFNFDAFTYLLSIIKGLFRRNTTTKIIVNEEATE
ncbi:lipopolysaccharide biosynthesis protein [Lysinibacillus sp. Bpr_S20]|uniref:lipopolysaccharide biosynthesis protein n=1 Tax=Lysinibacillus sp. Bpr_S20 TaxID=2933964 RepID=UPI002013732D|nr:lipopolysaccharide biosynthesis protein [Lysinibacillus sp. Bpr_S20]MCL1703218.1 lipopolysaccharide biosynthesis protein [Lysinibacillus sp. Bpr_S20]